MTRARAALRQPSLALPRLFFLGRSCLIYPDSARDPKTPSPNGAIWILPNGSYAGFLDIELWQNLIELARDGLAAHPLARCANALVLLDDGMSCEAIAKGLLLDDDTIRTWYRLYEEDGI